MQFLYQLAFHGYLGLVKPLTVTIDQYIASSAEFQKFNQSVDLPCVMDDIESQMMREMKAQMKMKEEQNAKLMMEMQKIK